MYKDFPLTNYAYGILTAGPSAGDSTMTLDPGYIGFFPDPAVSGEYNVIVWNATDYPNPLLAYDNNQCRILGVTGIAGNVMSIRQPAAGNDYNNEGSTNTAVDLNTASKVYRVALCPTVGLFDKLKGIRTAITIGMSGNVFEPVDYLCDGTADDVQIQAALEKANLNNSIREIVVHPGTYDISASLEKYKSSFKGTDALTCKFVWSGTTNTWMIKNVNSDSFKIENITLDGGGISGVTLLQPGSNTDKLSLYRVFFMNAGEGLNTGNNDYTTASRARTSNVATIITQKPHGMVAGQTADMSGLGGTGYNTTGNVITLVNSTTFTYANTGGDEGTTADTGGTVLAANQNFWDSTARDCFFYNCDIGVRFGEFQFRLDGCVLSACTKGVVFEENSNSCITSTTFTGNDMDIYFANNCNSISFVKCWFEESVTQILNSRGSATGVKNLVFDNCHFHTAATSGSMMDFTNIRGIIQFNGGEIPEGAGPTTTTITEGADSYISYNNIQHIATGTGTVTYPGTFKVKQPIYSAEDSDSTFRFGRAKMGYNGSDGDWFYAGHFDHFTTSNYNFAMGNNGTLLLNAPTGQSIFMRINNSSDKLVVNGTGVGVGGAATTQKFEVYKDYDESAIIGRGHLGYNGSASDAFIVSHLDRVATPALYQDAAGATALNCANGQTISFRLNSNEFFRLVNTSIEVFRDMTFEGTSYMGLRVANLTTAERDALTPFNGNIIYNVTTGVIQGYGNGSWHDLY